MSHWRAQLRCHMWYEYVTSKANIADPPSRGDRFVVEAGALYGFDHPFPWFGSSFALESLSLW